MQSHLDGLISVAVVAVVDDVEGLNVGAHNPVQHLLVLFPDVVEVQRTVALNTLVVGNDELTAHFVTAAVDGVKQGLGGVNAGAEELHLLTYAHRGYAAGDSGVVAPVLTNLGVRFVLNRGGLDGDGGAEVLVTLGQVLIPEDGDVRLGSRAQVAQGLQQTEGGLGDQGTTVVAETSVRPGGPVGVAGEDLVVSDGAQEADNAQLHDQVVDQLLSARLSDLTGL